MDLSLELNASNNTAIAQSLLAKIYEMQKQYEKALTYYKKYHDMDIQSQKEALEERLHHIRSQFKIEQAQHEKENFQVEKCRA